MNTLTTSSILSRQRLHTASILLLCLSLFGCGGQDAQQIPGAAILSASPNQVTWDIDVSENGCVYDQSFYNDHAFLVSLSESNSAIGDIDVNILANLSGTTFPGSSVIQLFEDTNGNGAIDNGLDLPVSELGSGAYRMRLNDQGYNTLLVRVNLSCGYKANIQLFAGAATTSISVQINENIISEPGEEPVAAQAPEE